MKTLRNLWGELRSVPLYLQLRRVRWLAFPGVMVLAAIHQVILYALIRPVPTPWQWWIELIVYTFTGSIVAWLGITWIADSAEQRAEIDQKYHAAANELETNQKKMLALHELGERVASARDEQAVLELAARAPIELVGAQASTVITFDDETDRLKLNMAWGLSDSYLKLLQSRIEHGIPMHGCYACSQLRTEVSVDCPLFTHLDEAAFQEGIRSLICTPFDHENERMGIISSYFSSPEEPPEDYIRLLNILGGTIAIALESIRVRRHQMETLQAIDRASQIGGTILEDPDSLSQLSRQVLNITLSGWDMSSGGVFLQDHAETWTCYASQGLGNGVADPHFEYALNISQQALKAKAPIIKNNPLPKDHLELRSIAAAPLIAEGESLGAIFLGAKRRNAIQENHVELLNTMAHQIALVIRNAQLYTQLGQMAVLKERNRLSREFHDGLAQTLGYLGLQAERVEHMLTQGESEEVYKEISNLRQTIRGAYVDVREAIDGLRLSVENPANLADHLEDYANAFTRQTGIQTDLQIKPAGFTIRPAVGLQVLRIAQEALTNIRKHAHASEVRIGLTHADLELELVVTDNGDGFPQEVDPDRSHRSLGLTTMRERAESLGGTLTVATSPGQGTRITALIPTRGKNDQSIAR